MIDQALSTLTSWFFAALAFLGLFLGAIDGALHRALSRVGIPGDAQFLVVLLVDVFLVVLVLRTFRGVIRVLLIVFLILLVLHILLSAAGFDFVHQVQR